MANALLSVTRQKRLAESERLQALDLYGSLPLMTDAQFGLDTVQHLHALGQTYSLSAYDAAYLELAKRRGLTLATIDRPLARAARAAGVPLADLKG